MEDAMTLAMLYLAPNQARDIALVNELVERFYTLPDNDSGGLLHIVLDDGNCNASYVVWCREQARAANDGPAFWLAQLLLTLTDSERESL